MASVHGLLQNRKAAIVISLCLAYVAAVSWMNISKTIAFPTDPIHVFGLAFSIFVAGSITFRSSFAGDRIVFGAATVAFALVAITMSFPMPRYAMLIVVVTKSLAWTTGAVSSIALSIWRGMEH